MPRLLAKTKSKILTISGTAGAPRQTTILSFFSPPKPKLSSCSQIIDLTGNITQEDMTEKRTEENPIASENLSNPSERLKIDDSQDENGEDTETDTIRDRLKEQSKLLSILDKNMGLSWFAALESNFSKEYFSKLNQFVTASRFRGTVFPPQEHVWEWTKQYPIQDVKVIILGQDPYHGPNQAHGLCFSVKKGVALPPSLQNMYKELEQENIGFQRPDHGCLTGWSEQGVLLLNAVLTVDAHKPNSHKDKGWENITDAVIRWISENLNSVVFLLWGSYAQKKAAIVDKKKHRLLMSPHPSPFSANRGFFGCNHFAKCNELLEKSGKKPINWAHLP